MKIAISYLTVILLKGQSQIGNTLKHAINLMTDQTLNIYEKKWSSHQSDILKWKQHRSYFK